MFLFGFLLLVKQVYAAYYENPFSYFFYSVWDGLWYGSFGYSYYSASLGYILLVTALLYAVIQPLSRQIKIFKDAEHKNAALVFSIVLSFLIAWATPFAMWLQGLLYDVAWISILLLLVLLGLGIYSALGTSIRKASKAVSKASKERYESKAGLEGAKKGYEEAKKGHEMVKISKKMNKDELKLANELKKDIKGEQIKSFKNHLNNLDKKIEDELIRLRNLRKVEITINNNLEKIKNQNGGVSAKNEKIIKKIEELSEDIINCLQTYFEGFKTVDEIRDKLDSIDIKEERDKALQIVGGLELKLKEIGDLNKLIDSILAEVKKEYNKINYMSKNNK